MAGSPERRVVVYPWTVTDKPRRKPYWLKMRNEEFEREHVRRMVDQHKLCQAWIDAVLEEAKKEG